MGMSQPYVVVVAHLAAKPGCEEALKAVLLSLVGPTRTEEGCLLYDLHQGIAEPARFVFYENWASQEALNKHLGSEHLRGTVGKATDLMDGQPSIVTYWKIA